VVCGGLRWRSKVEDEDFGYGGKLVRGEEVS
jgi:hypothetical protein